MKEKFGFESYRGIYRPRAEHDEVGGCEVDACQMVLAAAMLRCRVWTVFKHTLPNFSASLTAKLRRSSLA